MTPDIIRQHYNGPKRAGRLAFSWSQKGRRWPRHRYVLFFVEETRQFQIDKFLTMARRGRPRQSTVFDESLARVFVALLSPEQVAECMAAAIAATRGAA